MKNLFKALILGLFVMGLANCSGGGGGGAAAPAPANAAADAAEIQFTDENGESITWNNQLNDIFVPLNNEPGCVYGISEGSNDKSIIEFANELAAIINSSVVGKGSQAKASDDSRYLTITYNDGKKRTFNLDNDLATTQEEILSKNEEILDFFADMEDAISDNGDKNCNEGKGDK